MKYDVIILGAGPAGLTAALYAKRYGLVPVVVEKAVYGGQLISTPAVENYTGIKSITGVDLAMSMVEQVTDLEVEIRLEEPLSCSLAGAEKAVITTEATLYAPTVIVANGAQRRKLGCPGEQRLSGKGVSYCATCDGSFYKGMEVAVIGGGNTALEDALFLSNLCKRVHLVHRRDTFRGNQSLADAVRKRESISIHYNSVPLEIDGGQRVESLILQDTQTQEKETLALSGVFVAIGLEPDNSMFAGQLALDAAGYIVAGEDCRTSVAGVFAAGDTRTKALRQIITAAADGAVAAFGVANLISESR